MAHKPAPRPPSGLPGLPGWSVGRVAEWVGARPVVMGWPYNGTRRWFVGHRREHPGAGDYLTTIIRRQAGLRRMVLDHGVRAILAPSFGELNLGRGMRYARHALGGLLQVASDDVYAELFRRGVRLRFYGDYREALHEPEYRPMIEACEEIMAATAGGDGPLVLLGLFADSPHETVARLAVSSSKGTAGCRTGGP